MYLIIMVYFSRGSDSVLGETSDPLELFMADDCEDSDLQYTVAKVQVPLMSKDHVVYMWPD